MEIEQSQEKALQIHLADFENCSKRIEHYYAMQAQLMSISITIIAGVVSIVALGNNVSIAHSIFLIGSLIMGSLCWALAESSMQVARLNEYVERILTPKIQKLIGREHPLEFKVLVGERSAYKSNILASGKHGISYIAGVTFLLMFIYQKDLLREVWFPIEWICIIASLILMLVPPANGLVWFIRTSILKNSRKK